MMEEIPYRTQKNQRVRLKGEAESLYPLAHSGAPGWVRGHRKDEFGYPQVRIEWDKDWWGYNGEQDRWAIEAHFDIVEDKTSMSDSGIPPEIAAALAAVGTWAAQQQQPETAPPQPEPEPAKEPEAEAPETAVELKAQGVTKATYDAEFAQASEFVGESDAFLVVAVRRVQTPQGVQLVPKLFTSYQDAQSGLLLEMQMAKFSAQTHNEVGVTVLSLIGKKDQG